MSKKEQESYTEIWLRGSAELYSLQLLLRLRERLGNVFCALPMSTFSYFSFFFSLSHDFLLFFSAQCTLVGPMQCSRTHKLHFSATFSLKMGLTAFFIHLKIILLQCFQFTFFNFQFSAK